MAKDNRQHVQPKKNAAESFVSIWADKLVFWLLLATVVVIPLYFNIISFDQFEMPKLTFLRIMTCIMAGLWAVRIFENGKFEFTLTPLDLPMLGLAIMNIVTTFTSFAPQLSFRGEYENFAGSLSNLNYIFLYFIAVNHINTQNRIRAFNYALLTGGFLITIYALAQFFGYDFIKWNEGSMIKGRYFASMGNPNFLGALLAMVIPVNIAFLMINMRAKKYAYAAGLFMLFILIYIALFGTQSRAPYLAFAASLLVFGIYWITDLVNKASNLPANKGKNTFALLFFEASKHIKLLGFAAAFVAVAAVLSITAGRDASARLWNSVTHMKQSMSVSRLHIWIPALKMIKDNPVLGTGVDTFKSVFPKYAGTNFAQIDGANVSSRTAHNELLNIASTMGIATLGTYLLLIAAYILMWYRSFMRTAGGDMRLLSVAMFASFTAYFVQNLFSFGVAAINTYLYLIFASHAVLYAEFYGNRKKNIKLYETASGANTYIKIVFQGAAALLVVFFAYKAFMIYSADVHYNKGKILGGVQNRWDLAVLEHQKSVEEAPTEVKYHVYLALAYEKLAMGTQDRAQQLELMHKAVYSYKKGVELNPGNSYYWGNLGRIYTMIARYEDNKYFQDAIDNYRTAIDKAPVTGLFYNNLVELYLALNMPDKAMPYLNKLEMYDKSLAANSYFLLGNVYFGQKLLTEAEAAYRKSLDYNPEFAQSYYNLGIVCAGQNNRDCAVTCLQKFIALSPGSEMEPNAKKILRDLGVKP